MSVRSARPSAWSTAPPPANLSPRFWSTRWAAFLIAFIAPLAPPAIDAARLPTALSSSPPTRVHQGAATACVEDAQTLCLADRRFAVSATWRNQFDGTSGSAHAVPNTDVAGFFYFSDPANLELLLKILDFGDTVKLFYGQLTNLPFELAVRDSVTGIVRTYGNGPADCGAIVDNVTTVAGAPRGKAKVRGAARRSTGVRGAWLGKAGLRSAAGNCVPGGQRLCLLDGRFAVELAWRNHYDGSIGNGSAAPLSDLSGTFAYNDPNNVELLAKTLDFGDRILFLYGALSNLEYDLTLTDTVTERTKRYNNPAGRFCGGLDNDVLASAPPTTGPIGPAGGRWVGLDGAIEVEVPPGALATEVQLTATRVSAAQLNLDLDPDRDDSSLVALGPETLQLAVPATVHLRYDPDRLPPGLAATQITVARLSGSNNWSPLANPNTDATSRTASGEGIDRALQLGVRRASASAPCAGPEHRQFDYWVGSWSFTQVGVGGAPAGNEISRDEAGCFVFENFTGTRGYRGRSVSFYDPLTQTWSQTYVDTQNSRLELVGRLEGNRMVLYETPTSRFVWDPLDANRIRYFQEVSNDAGTTWRLGQLDGTYTRR